MAPLTHLYPAACPYHCVAALESGHSVGPDRVGLAALRRRTSWDVTFPILAQSYTRW